MNTFFILCLSGIILNSIGIAFNIYILNIIGCILTAIGIFKLNITASVLKKAKLHAVLSVPFSVIAFSFTFLNLENYQHTISCVSLGLNVFFYIYFTFYFTEALIQCAKGVNELAATRSFRGIWTLTGIATFIYFMAYTSLIPSVVNIIKIIFLIAALYYCMSLHTTSKVLFKNNE